jgi:hypothetical protein
MAPLEGTVESHSGNGLTLGIKAQKEEGNAVAFFEVAASKGLFKSATAIDALGAIEVHLPQIRSFKRMVALKTNARGLIDEARSIAIALANCVSH